MTLIITALSDDAIIQVSDRRLTIDGKLYDDSANKAICVTCADARFTVAYTGQVEINGQRTDEWLVDHLGSIDAGAMNFLTIYESMKQHAISTFSILHSLGRAHGITFVFAGFGLPGPFAAVLSNIEDTEGHWLKDIDNNFHSGFYFRNEWRLQKLDLMINGREDTIPKTIGAVIPKVRKHYLHKNTERRVKILVQLIRMAADDPKSGHFIGKNCMSIIVPQTGDFTASYHPVAAETIHYSPHLIMPGLAAKHIWFSGPPNSHIRIGIGEETKRNETGLS